MKRLWKDTYDHNIKKFGLEILEKAGRARKMARGAGETGYVWVPHLFPFHPMWSVVCDFF